MPVWLLLLVEGRVFLRPSPILISQSSQSVIQVNEQIALNSTIPSPMLKAARLSSSSKLGGTKTHLANLPFSGKLCCGNRQLTIASGGRVLSLIHQKQPVIHSVDVLGSTVTKRTNMERFKQMQSGSRLHLHFYQVSSS